MCNLGEQRLHYKIEQWGKQGTFDILRDISETFTLVQLMDTVGNVNHAVSIVGYWIFDSNYKKGASVDTRCIESHVIPFGNINNFFHI